MFKKRNRSNDRDGIEREVSTTELDKFTAEGVGNDTNEVEYSNQDSESPVKRQKQEDALTSDVRKNEDKTNMVLQKVEINRESEPDINDDGQNQVLKHKSKVMYKRAGPMEGINANVRSRLRDPFAPIAAPTHIRVTSRFDFQADVCKDFKETGYCGYGDSCKFVHDRSNYKAGWEIEREWELDHTKNKNIKNLGGTFEKDPIQETADNNLCTICKEQPMKPVEAKCGHRFCQSCAVKCFTNGSKTCSTCGTRLDGSFKTLPT